jgi:hypothetical protein
LAFASILAPAMLPLGLAGCARKTPAAAPPAAYPYAATAPRVFYATAEGLSESPPAAAASGEGSLASRSPNASVISSDGARIFAAVNGWGIVRIESEAGAPGGGAYRLAGTPLPQAFAGLTTGGAWPLAGGVLVQLFHDPFSEDPVPPSHLSPAGPASASRLVFLDAKSGAATAPDPLPVGLDPGFELFAFLPAGGRWFAELRKDAPERVDLKFLALSDPLSPAGAASGGGIGRSDFEAALRPEDLGRLAGEAGVGLRSALKALGEGPWLIRLRSSSGTDSWYVSGGRPEEAAPIFAWSDSVAGRTIALRPDGLLASSEAQGKTSLSTLPAPVPGAAFTALATAGDLAAAAWESGDFPYLTSAGIVVAPLPR